MIKQTKDKSSQRVSEILHAVLPRSVEICPIKKNSLSNYDFVINDQPIEIKWVGEGTLANAKQLISNPNIQRPFIVVARFISPGARNILSNAEISWVDETGAAEINIDKIIVSRTGYQTKSINKSVKWTPSVIAVAETLLCGTKPTISATKDISGYSDGSCTHALQLLTKLNLLEANIKRGRYSARRIRDQYKLLEAYSAAIETEQKQPSLQIGVIWKDVISNLREIGMKLNRINLDWAVTGIAASDILAPYLTNVSSAEIYVNANTRIGLEAIAKDMGLQPINGGRLTIKPFPKSIVKKLIKNVYEIRIVSWPRIYADLLSVGVRGEEAAEHLREKYCGR